ncbi:hypothetical protein DAPPUDRAFT_241300 [Daphnia pulex]|uniref:CUB domain-containing protein n=1 Tax=Daphnia pulex TaxID=6669 RepID=E9GDX4_DAPPU|nr:hypothetical protein DAPPUDRAFT_241300 [Daphnia pulex]|eukprot:EFX82162.1 hypothetical protein DAPPUDRAFT_241300 [Daphnia pulex]
MRSSAVLFVLIVLSCAVFTTSDTTLKTTTKSITTTKTTEKPTTTSKTTAKPTTTAKTSTATTKTTTKPTTKTTPKQITTTVKPKTGPYLVCQDTNSTAANGTLRPADLTGNTTTYIGCFFDINVNSNYQIQIICPFINITKAIPSRKYVRMAGIVEGQLTSYMGYSHIISNRVYYSINNRVSLSVRFGYPEWFQCQWTSALRDKSITNYKLCRNAEATAANGTIQTTPQSDTGPARTCSFAIKASAGQQILFSCSVVQLDTISAGFSTFSVGGIINNEYNPPILLNRIYYSYSDTSDVVIDSTLDASDSITCKWTTKPREITTAFQLCRHGETTAANGTIQPFVGLVKGEPSRSCSFLIIASPNQQIQISCSIVNLTSPSAFLMIEGIVEDLLFPKLPVPNRVYYSYNSTDVKVSSQFAYSDSLNCKFTTTPMPIVTTNFKLCRDSDASGINSGTIQTLTGMAKGEPSRDCRFIVYGPADKFVKITCSIVKLNTTSGSQFQLMSDSGIIADPPIANQIQITCPFSNITNAITSRKYVKMSRRHLIPSKQDKPD